jgi:hypothetical protein
VLSAGRLRVVLSLFTLGLVVGLSTLLVVLTDTTFASITPSIAQDLAWKAHVGARDVVRTAELSILVGDADGVRAA